MAALDLSAETRFPHIVVETLDATPDDVRAIILPQVPFALRITLQTRSGDMHIAGGNAELNDSDAVGADYFSIAAGTAVELYAGARRSGDRRRHDRLYIASTAASDELEIMIEEAP